MDHFGKILASSPHATDVDKRNYKLPEWTWSTQDLLAFNGGQQLRGGKKTEEELRDHLFLRYALTSLRTGQIPHEWQRMPKEAKDMGRKSDGVKYAAGEGPPDVMLYMCSVCRAKPKVMTVSYEDLSDEEDEDNYHDQIYGIDDWD